LTNFKPASFSRSTVLHGVKASSWPMIPLLENARRSQRYERSARCCSIGAAEARSAVILRVTHAVQQDCFTLKMVLGFIQTWRTLEVMQTKHAWS